MRPIDGDALQARFASECIGECACCPHAIGDTVNMRCKLIEEAPTLDVEEVVHGYWLYGAEYGTHNEWDCSVCGEYVHECFDNCPHCRAKMDERCL